MMCSFTRSQSQRSAWSRLWPMRFASAQVELDGDPAEMKRVLAAFPMAA